ncbi:kinase-like domain-containing protein [Aspergillus sergii]|uniref:Altered inheritance of mitochondria protein 9, mitochondrial n=1 Tax=Aspergillus sergii TaxID=1034303 RepID=A0A5N6X483_9EURO|nr:kinase-like domain-containing protein [Aspergillus sergii]
MQHIKQLRFSHHGLNFINPAKQRAPFKPILQPSVVGPAPSARDLLRYLSLPTSYNQTRGANSSSSVSLAVDPYSYTSGRWLNRDDLQRKSRRRFNRVFALTLDSGHRLAAKLPTKIAGPPRLTINSEVATMEYLRLKTSIPIPKGLTWSDDPSNPVRSEYIIQEHVEGVQLHGTWPSMSTHQHMLCTKAISFLIKEMAALDFPAFGSLYFSDSPIDQSKKIPLQDERFCIGPSCSPIFWNTSPGEMELYGGPSVDCGPCYTRIPQGHMVKDEQLPYQGSIQDHTELLETRQKVLDRLIQDPRILEAASPTLIHADLHKRNIYVSPDGPTVVTGVIDWQSTNFASRPSESQLAEVDESAPDDQKKKLNDAKICHQTYDVCMKGLVTKLRQAMLLDPALVSATALRQELMELSARWSDLGMQGSCPYLPDEQQVAIHAELYEYFGTVQRLKMWLRVSLGTDSDGWVLNDVWEAAKDAHRAAYNEWMETARNAEAKGDELTVKKADRLWPFDSR